MLKCKVNLETNMNHKKILVAYFSLSGNTRKAARQIQSLTGADVLEVKTVRQYAANYNAVVQEAKEEKAANARPELVDGIGDMTAYDIVILGYPIWWWTMPMAMFTFLEQYDFSGKTMVPFCTHGGTSFGESPGDIARLAPGAAIAEGLSLRGGSIDKSQSDIKAWLQKLEIL